MLTKQSLKNQLAWKCDSDDGNRICYFKNVACKKLKLSDTIEVGIGDYIYAIPLTALTYTSEYKKRKDCDLFVTPLTQNEKTIRLGDPFFVSFTPIFDVENDRIGLAINSQAPQGSKITPRKKAEAIKSKL